MTRKLTLVGVLHSDPEGESRLVRAINQLSPECLTIDITEKSVGVFPEPLIDDIVSSLRGDQILRLDEGKVDRLKSELRSYGFLRRVADKYQSSPSPKLFMIGEDAPDIDKPYLYVPDTDIPAIIKEYHKFIFLIYKHLTSSKNFPRELVTTQVAAIIARTFYSDMGRSFIFDYEYRSPMQDKTLVQERLDEVITAAKIMTVWNEHGGDVMHVSGLYPVFGQHSKNLYEQLKDLNPMRYRLNEF